MKVVLADVEEAALAQQTIDNRSEAHLLFNNAGVATGGAIWESSLADGQWTMGVNLNISN